MYRAKTAPCHALRWMIAFIAAFLCLAFCRLCAHADNAEFNLLIYMVASDLESDDSCATENINEMIAGARHAGGRVNVLVYAGGTKKWHNDIFTVGQNRCVLINDSGVNVLYSEKARDMTSPETLASFIRFCRFNYPARKSMIILWDHGGGIYGFGSDELFNKDSPMSIEQLDQAFTSGGQYFDIIGFDACLMSTVETAFFASHHGRYLVASEAMEPNCGWDYTALIKWLSGNVKAGSLSVCRAIVDQYMLYCKENAPSSIDTLSVIDLQRFRSSVPTALREFSSDILRELDAGNGARIASLRASAKSLSRSLKIDAVDAIDFAESFGSDAGKRFAAAIRESLVYVRSYPTRINLSGMSIFMPFNKVDLKNFDINDEETLRSICSEDSYSAWIISFAAFLSDEKGSAKETTLYDVLYGIPASGSTPQLQTAASQNHALDLSDCVIYIDEDDLPRLSFPQEKLDLISSLFFERLVSKGDRDFLSCCIMIKPESFPLKNTDFWKTLFNGGLYINGQLCPFFTEELITLTENRIAMYGFTLMDYTDESGSLNIRLVYDTVKKTVTLETISFQEMPSDGDGSIFYRTEPVSDFDESDIVSFYSYEKCGNGDYAFRNPPISELKWSNVKSIEWKAVPRDQFILPGITIEDIYGFKHLW